MGRPDHLAFAPLGLPRIRASVGSLHQTADQYDHRRTLRDWFHENARDSRHIYELVGPNEKLDKNETKSFVNHTHEYAERQILRAGYRLAHVLNELFD